MSMHEHMHERMTYTSSSQDMQLGTNVIGHYFFTTLLLPALETAAANGEKARVVNVSSTAAYLASGLLFDSAKDGPERKKRVTWDMYNTSKLVRIQAHLTSGY